MAAVSAAAGCGVCIDGGDAEAVTKLSGVAGVRAGEGETDAALELASGAADDGALDVEGAAGVGAGVEAGVDAALLASPSSSLPQSNLSSSSS